MYLFENQALFMIVVKANSKITVNNLLFINKLFTVDQVNEKIFCLKMFDFFKNSFKFKKVI